MIKVNNGNSKQNSKAKRLPKLPTELEELPPIKKKDPKKYGSYGKTTLFSKKKPKAKYISPYVKKKMGKYHKIE